MLTTNKKIKSRLAVLALASLITPTAALADRGICMHVGRGAEGAALAQNEGYTAQQALEVAYEFAREPLQGSVIPLPPAYREFLAALVDGIYMSGPGKDAANVGYQAYEMCMGY